MIKPSMTPERQWEIISSFLTDIGIGMMRFAMSGGRSALESIECFMDTYPVTYKGILKPVEPPVVPPWQQRLMQHKPESELTCLDCINHKRCKNPLHEAGAPVCNDFVPYGVKKG